MQAPTIGGVRVRKGNGETVRLARGASLTDFAEKIGVDPASLVQMLFHLGEMVTATQSVNDETLELLGDELNYDVQVVSPEDEDRELLESFDLEFGADEGDEGDLVVRPPVVTVMGHVDHGKTKLLDAIRNANVVAEEAGGITQHIGAYQVATEVDGDERRITFIDTPGHEAFTAMRARGAQATDIAVLVVAADDGVMPQTIEALNHAKAAERADRGRGQQDRQAGRRPDQGARPADRVRPGARGVRRRHDVRRRLGQVRAQPRQAARGDRPDRRRVARPAGQPRRRTPRASSIEAHLDRGRGPVATVLVQRGTLRVGDSIVAGPAYGRVRAMLDEHGDNDRGGRPVASGAGARSDRRPRRRAELPGRRRRPDGPSDRREARGARARGHAGQAPRAPYPRGLHGLHGEGREPGAQPDPQGRRVRFGRGARGRAGQDRRRRRGLAAGHRPRCRCDHRDQRRPGRRLRRHHHRLQRPPAGQGDRAGRRARAWRSATTR